MKKDQALSSEKILGANYIAQFFEEIRSLTEQYANYKNILLEMEYKLAEKKESDESEQNNLKVSVQNIRFFSNKVYIHFMTLKTVLGLKEEVSKPIIEAYEKITNPKTFLPELKNIELFVIEINKLLVNDIIKSLLETSQDIMNSLYQR